MDETRGAERADGDVDPPAENDRRTYALDVGEWEVADPERSRSARQRTSAVVGIGVLSLGILGGLYWPPTVQVTGSAVPVDAVVRAGDDVLGNSMAAVGDQPKPLGVPDGSPTGAPEQDEGPAGTGREEAEDRDPGTSTGPAVPPPARESGPGPRPPSGDRPVAAQRPGTIRLPEGGTAALVRREVGPDRVLPVPENLEEATWWGMGLGAPSGASVFAGHVNFRGQRGPFAELWDTTLGDVFTVVDQRGEEWRYRVSAIHTLHKNELPANAEALFGQEGAHRVVLVTCGGRWHGGDLGYEDNRIVVALPA
ncbi:MULTISPECIES: class F sortase [Actinoalloteichus]|uniref:Sortase family protein n=1 Tax=Actinoalloteichus caeruleus DSM 43889 TaxID=1120930 RepID=A0ABT1JIS8_ACTCY|nr:sortase [Actinoalloteichus caeruleus]MCP2332373.1 Sortase family protein [Actinoalloteichus caeruleus DSM 43889]